MEHRFLKKAFEWVKHSSGEGILSGEEHCLTRDIFQARLDQIRLALEGKGVAYASL